MAADRSQKIRGEPVCKKPKLCFSRGPNQVLATERGEEFGKRSRTKPPQHLGSTPKAPIPQIGGSHGTCRSSRSASPLRERRLTPASSDSGMHPGINLVLIPADGHGGKLNAAGKFPVPL